MTPTHSVRACVRLVFITLVLLLGGLSPSLAKGPDVSPRPVLRPGSIPPADAAELLNKIGFSGQFGFALYDLASGAMIEQGNADARMAPASVTKVITALYALDHLGPEYRFTTQMLATGPVVNGRIQGDLYLQGGGDPTLDSDGLANLVATLRDQGITGITGQFYYDDAALPNLREIDGGQPVFVGYNPAVAGLNLNFNRIYFEWTRGQNGYRISMDARTDRIRPPVTFAQMKIQDRAGALFTYSSAGNGENWTVRQSALGKSGGRWLPTRDPGRYSAEVFAAIARDQGVTVPAPIAKSAPPTATARATHASARLADVVRDMLVHSTNLTAEVVGLTATKRAGHPYATLEHSAQAMTRWAKTRLGMTQSVFFDHSGLGDDTRVTSGDMIAALRHATSIDPAFEQRLKSIRPRTAKGDLDTKGAAAIAAKTGTLNFVSALSGYLTTQTGQKYAFAMFGQDLTARSKVDHAATDLPKGAKTWNTRARNVQSGLLYRWARLENFM